MAASFPYLIELVEASTAGLKDISLRRLFGCDAFFVGEHIFVLLWKEGRIGVKLRDREQHARLLALPGAVPWRMGGKVAANWVLVPEEMHDDGEALTPWVHEAYREVRQGVGRTVGTATMVVKGATKVEAKKTGKAAAKVAAKKATKVAAKQTTTAKKTGATRVAAKGMKGAAKPVARPVKAVAKKPAKRAVKPASTGGRRD